MLSGSGIPLPGQTCLGTGGSHSEPVNTVAPAAGDLPGGRHQGVRSEGLQRREADLLQYVSQLPLLVTVSSLTLPAHKASVCWKKFRFSGIFSWRWSVTLCGGLCDELKAKSELAAVLPPDVSVTQA